MSKNKSNKLQRILRESSYIAEPLSKTLVLISATLNAGVALAAGREYEIFFATILIVLVISSLIFFRYIDLRRRSRIVALQQVKKAREQYPKLSVVSIMRSRRSAQIRSTLIILSVGVIVNFIMTLRGSTSNIGISIIFLVLIVGVLLKQAVFEYRIRKGMYGTNEREAREIITFILQESQNIDFDDQGKPKRLITEEDLEEIKQDILQPAPRMASITGGS